MCSTSFNSVAASNRLSGRVQRVDSAERRLVSQWLILDAVIVGRVKVNTFPSESLATEFVPR